MFYTRAFNEQDPAGAVAAHAGPTYIQHNPAAPDGTDGFIAFAASFLETYPGLQIDVLRTLAEDDMVVTHSRMSIPGAPDTAIFDLWRLQGKSSSTGTPSSPSPRPPPTTTPCSSSL